MDYHGPLYRALNPIHAREPLSGRGAALHGGRFNPRGTPALYTSLSVMTALREAHQVGSLQPTMLVSYRIETDGVFDGQDMALLEAHGMDSAGLADAGWRDRMKAGGVAPTQAFARRLIDAGYRALLVRSFAPGAGMEDLNLVLWSWPSLAVVDDEGRLGPVTGNVESGRDERR